VIKKFLFFAVLLVPALLSAQDDQQKNSSVELPSFVITGKDVISLPKLKKQPTGFISVVSEEYFKPAFTQDDFDISNIPDPGNHEFQSLDSVNYSSGSIEGAIGVNYRPYAKGNLSKQFTGGIFSVNALGFNKRAYVENSDRYFLEGGIGFTFFVNDGSPILANAKIKASADYSFDQYRLYATPLPDTKRALERGLFSVTANNPASSIFAYDFNFYNTINRISDDKFFENVLGAKGYTRIKLSDFSLNAKAEILNQRLSNKNFSGRNFYEAHIRPYASITLTSGLTVQGGFDFYKSDSTSKGYLYAAASMPLGMGISVYGEYAPSTELQSYYRLSSSYRFFNTVVLNNYILERKNFLNASFKYEFKTYYEINGGIEYYSSDNHPYFTDAVNAGLFNISYAKAASTALFVNLLFHKGPFGYFYGDARYNEVKQDGGNQLPFMPKMKINLTYGFDFENGIEAEAKLKYSDFAYCDLLNNQKLNSYFDLSFKGFYNFSRDFRFYGEINNFINSKNYYLKGYQEDTFNINLGINYKF